MEQLNIKGRERNLSKNGSLRNRIGCSSYINPNRRKGSESHGHDASKNILIDPPPSLLPPQPLPLSPSYVPTFWVKLISFPHDHCRPLLWNDAGSLSYPVLLAIFLLTINLLFSTALAASPNNEEELVCQKGVSGFAGATFPRGDILMEAGSTLEVYCRLDLKKSKGYNATFIKFKIFKANIPPEAMKTVVINETTALLRIENMNVSSPHLSCEIKPPGPGQSIQVCQNEVDVGYLPLPVEDFRCVAPKWKSLNCTWTKPYNPIPTNYQLQLRKRIGKAVNVFTCPNKTATPTSCTWDGRSDPLYMPNFDSFRLRIIGTNVLNPTGTTWDHDIDHWSIVVPEAPEAINQTFVSTNTVQITWSFKLFRYFLPGLYHEVKICIQNTADVPCNTTTVESRGTANMQHNLTFHYAYVNYTVQIRMRSKNAKNEAEFWSEPATTIVTSGSTSPDAPPRVDIGSYESVASARHRDVYVYWEPISRLKWNGPNFSYTFSVYEDEERRRDISPEKIGLSYAKFSMLQVLKSYRFEIWSKNDVGKSPTASQIFVPRQDQAVGKPKSVSKLEFSNGSFEVSWTPPQEQTGVAIGSYTVFRCASSKPRPYQCEGMLVWDVVSSVKQNRIKYDNLSHNESYQFAVSANSGNTSSGMEWASCTLAHNKVPEKLKPVRVTLTMANEIHIEWQLDCSYQSRIEGFKITYCLVEKSKTKRCIDNEQSEGVQGADETSYHLKKLKPYSSYMISVSVITLAGESQKSDPTYATTDESSPSTPPIGMASDIKNTSVTITMYPPTEPNGVITQFKIKYKSIESPEEKQEIKQVIGKKVMDPNSPGTDVTIVGLTSNTRYSYTVSACTRPSLCSESVSQDFTTDIGKTDMKNYPSLVLRGGSLVLEWSKPTRLNGPVKYFEVLPKQNGKEGEIVRVDFEDDVVNYQKELKFSCEADTNLTAEVRAVTELKTGDLIYGGWSPPGNFNCGGGTSWVMWVIVVIAAILVVALIGLSSTKIYQYLKQMKEFDVKLPPGMAVQDLNGFSHKHPKRTRKNSDGDTHSFGKENLTYQLQMTSTNNSDESKDILSLTESSLREKETGFTFQPDMAYDNKMYSEELENSESHLHYPESNRIVVGNACVGSLYTADTGHLNSKSEIILEPNATTHVPVTTDLSDSQLQKNGDDSDVEKRLSPSPTNRLLEETQLNEDEDTLHEFLNNGQNKSNYNNRIGAYNVESGANCKTIQNPLDRENLLSRPTVDAMNIELQPTSKPEPSQSDKDATNASSSVPDVLSSSSSPRARESSRAANNSFPNHNQSNLVAPTPASSSYVKWTQLMPDQFRNGDGPIGIGENGRRAPYCQVGILLDSN